MVEASACRDDVTHDHIFLKAAQVIDSRPSGGLGQHPGGVLEGSGAQEALGFERGFGNTEQHRLRFGRLATHLFDPLVLFFELQLVHLLAPEERSVPRFGDPHLAEHLTDDNLDVLVIDGYALQPINFLDLINEVLLKFLRPADIEDFVRVNRAFSQLLAFLDIVALEDDHVFADRDEVFLFNLSLLVFNQDAAFATHTRTEVDDAVDLGDFGGVLGTAGLEELGYARQTAGNVLGFGGFPRGLGHQRAGDD